MSSIPCKPCLSRMSRINSSIMKSPVSPREAQRFMNVKVSSPNTGSLLESSLLTLPFIPKQLGGRISGISPKLPLIQSHLPFMVGHLPLPHPHTNTTPDTLVTLSLLNSYVSDISATPETLATPDTPATLVPFEPVNLPNSNVSWHT